MGLSVELKGLQVKEIFEVKSGVSKNDATKTWKSVEVVVTEPETEQYPQQTIVSIFGEQRVDNFIDHFKVGDSLDISVNIKSNKSKDGRYFVKIDCWKFERTNVL